MHVSFLLSQEFLYKWHFLPLDKSHLASSEAQYCRRCTAQHCSLSGKSNLLITEPALKTRETSTEETFPTIWYRIATLNGFTKMKDKNHHNNQQKAS